MSEETLRDVIRERLGKLKLSVVFLDIDGVLNSAEFIKNNAGLEALDPKALKLVNDLLLRTEANVIITSTWRIGHSLYWIQHMFKQNGFDFPERIIGATINLPGKPRGQEIDLWLRQVPVDAFVILDDNADMDPFVDKLVETSFDTGLQPEHIEQAVKILEAQLCSSQS